MAEHPDFNDGFEEALESMQIAIAFVCVSDTSQGYTAIGDEGDACLTLGNAYLAHMRRVKTVYLAMRLLSGFITKQSLIISENLYLDESKQYRF